MGRKAKRRVDGGRVGVLMRVRERGKANVMRRGLPFRGEKTLQGGKGGLSDILSGKEKRIE